MNKIFKKYDQNYIKGQENYDNEDFVYLRQKLIPKTATYKT